MLAAYLTGCATNPFAQYYSDYTKQMPVAIQQRLLPSPKEPQVISITFAKHREEGQRLEERGYTVIGEAAFFGGGNPTQQQLDHHAKSVGAEIVLLSSEFSHAEQGATPIFTYVPGTKSTTTHSGTINLNPSGTGSYSGSSTTRTPAKMDTQYVPYQNRVYNYGATFWRRMKPGIFGAKFGLIPDSLRATLQRNTGAHLENVILDSPAFKANILRGDVVIQIADKPVTTPAEFLSLIPAYAGQKVTVRVIRGTRTIDVEVQLNPNPDL